jgi:indole-3-acetate monooxygenase
MTMAPDQTLPSPVGSAAPDLLPADSAENILANATAILPVVAEEADETERLARLSPRLARVMRDSGVFQMAFAAHRGGVQMTLEQQTDVCALVAAVDASAGWNVGVLNAGGYYASRLGDEAYAELYPSRDVPTCGSFHPRGHAQQVDGGYLVSGRWDWGSGAYVAEQMVGGALVFDGDEPVMTSRGTQMHLGLWLPREAVEIAHNWQTMGVRGSGSTSYSITEPVFVPESHSFDREPPYTPDADPLNKAVTLSHYALTGVVLGVAQHLTQLIGEELSARPAQDAAALQIFGEMIGEVDFAFSGVRTVARITDDIVFGDERVLTRIDEARMTAANAVAANALKRVLSLGMDVAHARYIRDDSPMQRVLRDGFSALAHAGTRRMHLGNLAKAALADGRYTIPDGPAGGAA